jgi:hypothetical protein
MVSYAVRRSKVSGDGRRFRLPRSPAPGTRRTCPPRLAAEIANRAGRIVQRALLARGAGVHVDFHAHRHFDNLWGLPGHSSPPKHFAISASSRHSKLGPARTECKARGRMRPSKSFQCRVCNAMEAGWPYINKRTSALPAGELNSLASRVPSLSGLAALKRFSTTARYSSMVSVPS